MGTYTVTFGTITTHPVLGGYADVVGSGDLWSDDTDATWAEMDGFSEEPPLRSAAFAQQSNDPPHGIVPAVTLTARIDGPPGALHTISPFFALLNNSQVFADPSAQGLVLGPEDEGGVPLLYIDDLAGGHMSTDPDGEAHTYTVDLPYTTDPFANGVWADVAERLASGSMYMAVHVGNAGNATDLLRVYEISLTLVTATRPPPLRRYPPVNNGGFGPTRHWPRTVNRLAGGSR